MLLHPVVDDRFIAGSVRKGPELAVVDGEGAALGVVHGVVESDDFRAVPRHVGGGAPVPEPDRVPADGRACLGRDAFGERADDAVVAMAVAGPRGCHEDAVGCGIRHPGECGDLFL